MGDLNPDKAAELCKVDPNLKRRRESIEVTTVEEREIKDRKAKTRRRKAFENNPRRPRLSERNGNGQFGLKSRSLKKKLKPRKPRKRLFDKQDPSEEDHSSVSRGTVEA